MCPLCQFLSPTGTAGVRRLWNFNRIQAGPAETNKKRTDGAGWISDSGYLVGPAIEPFVSLDEAYPSY